MPSRVSSPAPIQVRPISEFRETVLPEVAGQVVAESARLPGPRAGDASNSGNRTQRDRRHDLETAESPEYSHDSDVYRVLARLPRTREQSARASLRGIR